MIIETDDSSTLNTRHQNGSMETTFHNITITIPAASAKDAYSILCEALEPLGAEWTTDTYSVEGGEEKDTAELFGG